MGNERARRLADRIQIIVAQTLQKRVKDPRLGMVTITDVRITNDLREVTVFYTALGDEQARSESATALTKATGLVRSEVGRVTGLKHTPSVVFIADAIPENAAHIEDLLRTARESDEAVSAQRVGASYAGDPDPYRTPAVDSDDDPDDEDDDNPDDEPEDEPEDEDPDDEPGDRDQHTAEDEPEDDESAAGGRQREETAARRPPAGSTR